MPSPHFDLATYPIKDTIKLLTALLEKITRTNDRLRLETGNERSNYTCFHARSIPSISIHAYFTRIIKYCPCANECLLALLVYFDQMTEDAYLKKKSFHIDSYNVHRLIITGLMISSKLYSDVFFTNTRYAKVGGLPVSELNALELEFLRLNSYNMFVDINKLQSYGDNVLEHYYESQEVETLSIRDSSYHTEKKRGSVDELILSFNQLNNINGATASPLKHTSDNMDLQWKVAQKQGLFNAISKEIAESPKANQCK